MYVLCTTVCSKEWIQTTIAYFSPLPPSGPPPPGRRPAELPRPAAPGRAAARGGQAGTLVPHLHHGARLQDGTDVHVSRAKKMLTQVIMRDHKTVQMSKALLSALSIYMYHEKRNVLMMF